MSRQVALVTGGSRGIGRATALRLADAGVQVIVNYVRNEAAANATLADLAGDGHFILNFDVADSVAVSKAIDSVIERCGRLDILINNAAVLENDDALSTDYQKWQDTWDRVIRTNLIGTANAMFCALQHMTNNEGGRIVNVSSRGAFRGDPRLLAYASSKAGMKSLAQSLSVLVADQNIFVGTVAPGIVDTDMTSSVTDESERAQLDSENPTGRIATADEVAAAITFLALNAPYSMTGCVLDVNGASWLRP